MALCQLLTGRPELLADWNTRVWVPLGLKIPSLAFLGAYLAALKEACLHPWRGAGR